MGQALQNGVRMAYANNGKQWSCSLYPTAKEAGQAADMMKAKSLSSMRIADSQECKGKQDKEQDSDELSSP